MNTLAASTTSTRKSGRKNLAGFLSTTALAAAGIMVIAASPALASDYSTPTDGTTTYGSSATTHAGDTYTTSQNSNIAITEYDTSLLLEENETWNINQPGSSSLSAHKVLTFDADPTKILGTLNSNGKVLIVDPNGVFFGENSRIDVTGIIATTGNILDSDILDGNNVFSISDINSGSIELNGTINISDAGIAAFVAPTVRNSGIIQAKLGKVAFASGEKVTLDLYGDDLVEIALNSELTEALLENTGEINAEGGYVIMTAQAAKEAVNNIINMDGIINVSSVEQVGGKIILKGGDEGTVSVSGELNASGTSQGGEIEITGQIIDVTETSEITAEGNTSNIYIFGDQKASFNGSLKTGTNAEVEISGHEISLDGNINMGDGSTLTLDPANFTIDTAEATTIVTAMGSSDITVNVSAEDSITLDADIDTSSQTTSSTLNFADENTDGVLDVYLNRKITLGDNQTLTGDASYAAVNSETASIQNAIDVSANGAIVNVSSGTYNEHLNIDKSISLYGANASVSDYTARGAETIIDPLTTNSAIYIDAGADVEIAGFKITGAEGLETNASNPMNSIYIYNNVFTAIDGNAINIDGMKNQVYIGENYFSDLETGIDVDGLSTLSITNNYFEDLTYSAIVVHNTVASYITSNTLNNIEENGIVVENGEIVDISDNTITNIEFTGIYTEDTVDMLTIENNYVGIDDMNNYYGDGNIGTDGIIVNRNGGSTTVQSNVIAYTGGNGIDIKNSSGDTTVSGNTIKATNSTALIVKDSNGVDISNNHISDTEGNGIHLYSSYNDASTVSGNTILSSSGTGIYLREMYGTVSNNNLMETGGDAAIYAYALLDNTSISDNIIYNSELDGIYAAGDGILDVSSNYIQDTARYGIQVNTVDESYITENQISTTGNSGIYLINETSDDITSYISGNQISDAPSTTGIYVKLNDDDNSSVYIEGNSVIDTGLNGISVSNAGYAYLSQNNIFNVDKYGIYTTNVGTLEAYQNVISYTGSDGINIDQSEASYIAENVLNYIDGTGIYTGNNVETEIAGNSVNFAGINGIEVYSAEHSAIIENNNLSHIGINGIVADGTSALKISDNTLTEIRNTGIYSSYSDYSEITDNNLTNTGDYGIYAAGTDQYVAYNTIDTATTGGIYLHYSAGNTLVEHNIISNIFDSSSPESFGTGIYVESGYQEADQTIINDNEVYNVSGNGIKSAGNAVEISGNYVEETGDTGIFLYDPADELLVVENEVVSSEGNGIYVLNPTGNVSLYENLVANTALNGIYVLSTDILETAQDVYVTIAENQTYATGENGIAVESNEYADTYVTISENLAMSNGYNSIYVYDANEAYISGNVAGYALGNGIAVENSSNAVITENMVASTGFDGINVTDSTYTDINGNAIGLTGMYRMYGTDFSAPLQSDIGYMIDSDSPYSLAEFSNGDYGHGINVVDSYITEINDNVTTATARNGINVSEGAYVDITDNFVTFSGGNGIEVGNVTEISVAQIPEGEQEEENVTIHMTPTGYDDMVNIEGNNIIFSGENSIEVNNRGYTRISGNDITASGVGFAELLTGNQDISFDYDTMSTEPTVDASITIEWGDGDGIKVSGINGGDLSETTPYDMAEYDLIIENNNVEFSGGNGVSISNTETSLISSNMVEYSGIDTTTWNIYDIDKYTAQDISNVLANGSFTSILNADMVATSGIMAAYTLEDKAEYEELLDKVLEYIPVPDSHTYNDHDGIYISDAYETYVIGNTIYESGSNGLNAEGYNTYINLAGNQFISNPTGARFESGQIDFTGSANLFVAGDYGLVFDGINTPYSLSITDDDLGETEFQSQSVYYIKLANNALYDPGNPTRINGIDARYDGISPADTAGVLNSIDEANISSMIYDYNDDSSLGLIALENQETGSVSVTGGVDQKDVFRSVGPYASLGTGTGIIVRRMPTTTGGNTSPTSPEALGALEPAAGGNNNGGANDEGNKNEDGNNAADLASLEPSGGNTQAACWIDAIENSGSGQSVSFSFGNSQEEILASSAKCQSLYD